MASATAIAFPELLVRLAHILGIGRGADLVLYLSILFSFAAFFGAYGHEKARRWREFGAVVERHGAASAAAVACFEDLEAWVCA